MTDIETRIARSLAARVDRPVEVGALARLAVVRAGRVRARRRVVGAVAVAVFVVVGAVGVRTLPPDSKDTTLPVALGIPPAASRPEGIGATRRCCTSTWTCASSVR